MEELKRDIGEEQVKEIGLCCPRAILEPTETELKELYFNGDSEDINARVFHKLVNIWYAYHSWLNSQALADIIHKTEDAITSDDMVLMRAYWLETMDRFGKILGNTSIVEELKFLEDAKNKDNGTTERPTNQVPDPATRIQPTD